MRIYRENIAVLKREEGKKIIFEYLRHVFEYSSIVLYFIL